LRVAGIQMILLAMENDERRGRDEAREAVQKIRLEAELLRSAIAETRERIEESRQLLVRASPVKCPLAEAH
jgi:hypothetical protein